MLKVPVEGRRMMVSYARVLQVSAITSFAVGVMFANAVVSGHPAVDHYSKKWKVGTFNEGVNDRMVEWAFVNTVPTNGQRAAIQRGATDWNLNQNGVPYTSMKFVHQSADHDGYGVGCPNDYQKNKVGWLQFGGDADVATSNGPETEALGLAETCFIEDRLFAFKIKFNKDYNWYLGTDAVPADKWDLWSVSAQEFGHATGFLSGGAPADPGHWGESGEQCPDPGTANADYRHTLCIHVYKSSKSMRNLAEHDIHTFQNAYQ